MILRSLLNKLTELIERYEELGHLMSDADVIADQDRFRVLGQEYKEVEPVVQSYQAYQELGSALDDARIMLEDSDPDIRELAQEEVEDLEGQLSSTASQLQTLLLPQDPNDSHNVFLEIRAGTGGDEAALFAGDLFRMYSRFAESRKWGVEVLSERAGEHGGFREIITRIEGRDVYGVLKFESGAHRVQRVPETESQGRIHTSACTVAVMPEADHIDAIEINRNDLRIDTFRASGAGGQHVNKTDSAVRLTHLPSGTVVECQDERSQHKNKARAMSLLQARLLDAAQAQQQSEQAATRKLLVGSGDRSEKVRTYNFPQGRITDHRINLTLYRLTEVIGGELEGVIEPLIAEYQAEQLRQLAEGA